MIPIEWWKNQNQILFHQTFLKLLKKISFYITLYVIRIYNFYYILFIIEVKVDSIIKNRQFVCLCQQCLQVGCTNQFSYSYFYFHLLYSYDTLVDNRKILEKIYRTRAVGPSEYVMAVRELGNDFDKAKNNEILQQFLKRATTMVPSVIVSMT